MSKVLNFDFLKNGKNFSSEIMKEKVNFSSEIKFFLKVNTRPEPTRKTSKQGMEHVQK